MAKVGSFFLFTMIIMCYSGQRGMSSHIELCRCVACTDKSTGASNKHRYCTHLFKHVFYSEARHSYASLDFQQQTVLSSTLSPNHAKGQKGAQRTNKTKKLNQRKILGGLTSAHPVLLKHSYFQKDTDGLRFYFMDFYH